MADTFKIVPTHEEFEPSLGIHQVSIFEIGPIPVIFKIVDTKLQPDLLWSGIVFDKRYITAVEICQKVWAWHASDDLDNVKSFTNYIMNEFKDGKKVVVNDAIGIRDPIAISYKSIETEVGPNPLK